MHDLRKRAGMTQQELAEQLSVNRSTIAKWETGKALPRMALVPSIAAALHCSPNEVIASLSLNESLPIE